MAKWIIVVDDDTANLKMAGHILTKQKMRVTCIKSGAMLLKYIGEGNIPDIILLDINMPEMDGFETLHLLRDKEKEMGIEEIPVIFLTAEESTDTESRGFEMGVSDFIRKPFDPEVLLRRIDNIVVRQDAMLNLKSEATIDKLTGFLNKAAAGEELSHICTEMAGMLSMIDLDSFKLVNDLYGHEMGDKVLIAFAEVIRKNAPEGSRFGRIGGDEFVAFLKDMLKEDEFVDFTRRVNDDLVAEAKKLMGEDMNIPLGASLGGVMVPKHGIIYDTLLKFADKSLYDVKKNGKHGCRLYRAENYTDDELNHTKLNIETISEILGERSIPDVALQLDNDAFSYVYRYVMRYNLRNGIASGKLLISLDEKENGDRQAYMDACDEFGNHIRESLRKSDVFMRSRYNQYFILLTEMREEDSLEMVGEHLAANWKQKHGDILQISVEHEFITAELRHSSNDNKEPLQ
ncbi:MAG: diguanylate cyclase [Eubacterium sp.]|nr:diguanylate cyclase [Eubacterium sp.]